MHLILEPEAVAGPDHRLHVSPHAPPADTPDEASNKVPHIEDARGYFCRGGRIHKSTTNDLIL